MPCARVRKGSVAIWDAACRVKLGRIGPCRRRRWEPFRAPCACTGVMLPIHRVSDGSMLFPTGSGGGNDSRIAAICRGDLCDMACNRSRLSFPARRNDAGGRKLPKSEAGRPASISAVSDRVAMHHGASSGNDTCGRCVGCIRGVLRRGASASMPPLRSGGYARACFLLFLCLFFSSLSLRRISAQAIMPRRSRGRCSSLSYISDGVA